MEAISVISCSSRDDESSSKTIDAVVDDHEGSLPGFRFHPTDEELVSFYLKKKVEKRPLSIELIKQIDIYKHDPWDLAKASNSVGDKEWYFYCKRGRKYRNSIRPNRVTGSGFWKATGIDRPIYSNGGEGHHCVGLKKSLVYYRGSAGKGTKTDWMMHEFRLPNNDLQLLHGAKSSALKDTSLEAEIWTLCRILKRNKKRTPDWRELSARKNAMNSGSKTSSIDSNTNNECYISFATQPAPPKHGSSNVNTIVNQNIAKTENQKYNNLTTDQNNNVQYHVEQHHQQWNSSMSQDTTPTASYSSTMDAAAFDETDFESFAFYGHNWDDLNSVVEFAVRTPPL